MNQVFKKQGFLFINALILISCLEMTILKDLGDLFSWVNDNFIIFIWNVFFLWLFFKLLEYLMNRSYSIIIMNSLIGLLLVVNFFKYQIRKQVFVLKDILLIDEIFGIRKNLFNREIILIIFGGILLYGLFITLTLKRSKPEKLKLSFERKKVLIVLLLIMTLISFNEGTSFTESGYFYYLMDQVDFSVESDPVIQNIDEFMNSQQPIHSQGKHPNIIIVMSESFFNLKNLEGIEFSTNPLKNYDRLSRDFTHGYFLSPVYAGGTANSEFEVLTGMNAQFYEGQGIVYKDELEGPIMNLASILRQSGYEATGIHPHKNWYYERNEIYKDLGFHQFLSEEFMDPEAEKGLYISDAYLNDQIIKTLKDTRKPDFIYAITMQNHGPYQDHRYGEDLDVSVQSQASEEGQEILETYTQGLFDADESLGHLIKRLEGINEDTIVLFFGDHLPYLGKDDFIYDHHPLKMPQALDGLNENQKYYPVPYVLWSNFENDYKNKDQALTNMFYMTPKLLQMANIELPDYYSFLLGFEKKYPVIGKTMVKDANHEWLHKRKDHEVINDLSLFKGLQQLVMENRKHYVPQRLVINRQENFNQRYTKFKLTHIYQRDGQVTLLGENFYKNMDVYLNGERVNFTYLSENKITFKGHIDPSDHLQIVLEDSKGDYLIEYESSKKKGLK